ncbi:MAG: glycosyltransferase [Candidatus Melainabacteria bacterium]|nr:MAG: glycosyltransferase [Candidatus Melainabacteria bacterium]
MTAQPTVSVVIPYFDQPEFLRDAVESVIAQTYANVEIIVVDDCSPGVSAIQLLRGLRHPKLLVFKLESRKGSSVARNAGIVRSSGEYILTLDAADLLAPQYVSETVKYLLDSNDDGVCTAIRIFGGADAIVYPELEIPQILSRSTVCNTFIYKRSVFDAVEGYRENLDSDQERQFLLDALQKGFNFKQIKQPLYFRRENSASAEPSVLEDRYSALVQRNLNLYKQYLPQILSLQKVRVQELAVARVRLSRDLQRLSADDARLKRGLANVMSYYQDLEHDALRTEVTVGQL